jgi:(R,R)-butanediol dehydrogenase/meso-butanediol dehydrogenase/diacetyl reductase
MMAAVYYGRGDVRVESVPEPAAPGPLEVLLEVSLCGTCGSDSHAFGEGSSFIPLEKPHPVTHHCGPTVIGHEFIGTVLARGSDVEDLDVGNRVACGAGWWCGHCEWCRAGRINICPEYFVYGVQTHGGMAEYATVPSKLCRRIPEGCTDAEAACAQALSVSLHAVERSGMSAGDTVAVIGAGGVGAGVIAGAARKGVDSVIAVDLSEDRLAVATRLGATHELNGTTSDPVQRIREMTDGHGAHVVVEASGTSAGMSLAIDSARRGGTVLQMGLPSKPASIDLIYITVREINIIPSVSHIATENLVDALDMLEKTDFAEITTEGVVPLRDIVEGALVPMVEGRATGKLLIDPTA